MARLELFRGFSGQGRAYNVGRTLQMKLEYTAGLQTIARQSRGDQGLVLVMYSSGLIGQGQREAPIALRLVIKHADETEQPRRIAGADNCLVEQAVRFVELAHRLGIVRHARLDLAQSPVRFSDPLLPHRIAPLYRGIERLAFHQAANARYVFEFLDRQRSHPEAPLSFGHDEGMPRESRECLPERSHSNIETLAQSLEPQFLAWGKLTSKDAASQAIVGMLG